MRLGGSGPACIDAATMGVKLARSCDTANPRRCLHSEGAAVRNSSRFGRPRAATRINARDMYMVPSVASVVDPAREAVQVPRR